jgi:hypothetical protein
MPEIMADARLHSGVQGDTVLIYASRTNRKSKTRVKQIAFPHIND